MFLCEEYRNGLGFMLFEQIASEMLCLVDHSEIVDPHVIGFLDIESVDFVDDEALAPAWPFVVDAVFVEGRVVEVERDVGEMDVAHLVAGIAANETPVLAGGDDVMEEYTFHLSAAPLDLSFVYKLQEFNDSAELRFPPEKPQNRRDISPKKPMMAQISGA